MKDDLAAQIENAHERVDRLLDRLEDGDPDARPLLLARLDRELRQRLAELYTALGPASLNAAGVDPESSLRRGVGLLNQLSGLSPETAAGRRKLCELRDTLRAAFHAIEHGVIERGEAHSP